MLIAAITYYKTRVIRWVFIVIGLILVIANGIGLIKAQSGHFLMQKNEKVRTHQISAKSTVGDKSFIVTTKAQGGSFAYHYTIDGKSYRTTPKHGTTRIKVAKTPKLVEKATSYSANNLWSKFMLIGLPTSTPVTFSYTFELPNNWYVVSENQNQEIQKMVDASKDGLEDKIKENVTKAVEDAVQANPDYLNDKNAQKQTQDDIVKQVTGEIDDKLATDVAAKLKEWNLAK
nr:DUF4811 domain-containing protein [Weissella diestrammenae]